ncbi:MAG: dihydrofolate reductase [Cellvibrionaceae bacterium]|jgi:dihydrofolate reductase
MADLSIIVAMAHNRAIGKDNRLLWHLPEDLKYFKRTTMGKPMIMGRKTFESIGRPLPGRLNIVVTRQQDWQHEGVKVVHSIDAAMDLANSQASIDDIAEVMMIGGAELYQSALPAAKKIYLTRVDADIDGDAFFPELIDGEWEEVSRQAFSASEDNPYAYAFCVLTRT